MVGIFSKLSTSKSGHRRTQSALDLRGGQRGAMVPNPVSESEAEVASVGVVHGVEVGIEFKPVEHPTEPVDIDAPVQCPQPEPSILNDGRIWKERVSAANERRRADLPGLLKEGDSTVTRSLPAAAAAASSTNRMILPSVSAPEHNILRFLDECNASAM